MVDFIRPPRKDEVQYAGDVIRGKRPVDVGIIVSAAIAGAILGIVIGCAGGATSDEPLDPAFLAMCMGLCAVTLAVVAGLVLANVRSIKAICDMWTPARFIAVIACVLLVVFAGKRMLFTITFASRSLIADVALTIGGVVFALLFFNLGLRLVYLVYCSITGRDDEEEIARAISVDHDEEQRKAR